jgi:predicted CoA-binding protein
MGIERYDQLVQEFLGKKRIAIWGIEDAKSDPGHLVARKLHRQGIEVISVNPTWRIGGRKPFFQRIDGLKPLVLHRDARRKGL